MYKYFIYALATWLLAYTTLFYLSLNKPSNISKWVYDAYEKKTHIAHSTPSPRVVISAGSSSLFGINSSALSKALGAHVVNYSVNAGLMLPVILYKTKQIVKNGDILIMPLEYDMYLYDGEPNAQMIDFITAYEPAILLTLTLKEQFFIFWQTTLKSIITKFTQDIQTPKDIYGVHNIDENGDQLNTQRALRTQEHTKEVESAKPYEYEKLYRGDELSYMYLREFALYCKENEIKLILTPPSLLYKQEYEQQAFFKTIVQKLTQESFTYIGNPYDYMYSLDSFFNTDYHLNHEARELNTAKLIKELLPVLAN